MYALSLVSIPLFIRKSIVSVEDTALTKHQVQYKHTGYLILSDTYKRTMLSPSRVGSTKDWHSKLAEPVMQVRLLPGRLKERTLTATAHNPKIHSVIDTKELSTRL